jgi:tetratricopeptide (TPR) repeat protein
LLYARIGFNNKEGDRSRYYQKSLKAARKALELRPGNVQSHFVMGVALGRKALVASPSDRVEASNKIKAHAEHALREDSSHAGAHHLLGRWHLEITNLNVAERAAANWLFGGLPEGGSLSKAVHHLKRAVALDRDLLLYWYDLGRAYHRQNKRDQALHALQKAIAIDPRLESGKHYREKAQKLYNELK